MSDFYYSYVDDGRTLHLSSIQTGCFPPVIPFASNGEIAFWPWTGNEMVDKVTIGDSILLPSDASGFFSHLPNLTEIDGLENLDTSQVVNMSHMFEGCGLLADVSATADWDVSNVTDMQSMFARCWTLSSVPHVLQAAPLQANRSLALDDCYGICKSPSPDSSTRPCNSAQTR